MTAPPRATAVYVAYHTPVIDTTWIPPSSDLVIVHNDRSLRVGGLTHPRVRHVHAPSNLGFGAAVNTALPMIETSRVILCNPDTELRPEHWTALVEADPDEVVTVPLVDASDRHTWVVNPYPTPLSALLTTYRVGRLLDRDGQRRAALARLLGGWTREHAELRRVSAAVRPLTTHWASGAVMSWDTARLREVGGFDASYFLYFEDIDLCARMASRHPMMRVRVAQTGPGRHSVGASAVGTAGRVDADRHHLASLRRYVRSRRGFRWQLTRLATAPRCAWLSVRAARATQR